MQHATPPCLCSVETCTNKISQWHPQIHLGIEAADLVLFLLNIP